MAGWSASPRFPEPKCCFAYSSSVPSVWPCGRRLNHFAANKKGPIPRTRNSWPCDENLRFVPKRTPHELALQLCVSTCVFHAKSRRLARQELLQGFFIRLETRASPE